MSLVEALTDFAAEVVATLGPVGLFAVMLLESVVVPIPSEVILVAAGIAAGRGAASFLEFLIAATLGSLAGAMCLYGTARFLGRRLVEKYGKYLGISQRHLEAAADFFSRYGALSVFLARFVPGVRSLIGIPAGIARMNPRQYLLASGLGSAAWNCIFILLGVLVEGSMELFKQYSTYIDLAGVVAFIVLFAHAARRRASRHHLLKIFWVK